MTNTFMFRLGVFGQPARRMLAEICTPSVMCLDTLLPNYLKQGAELVAYDDA